MPSRTLVPMGTQWLDALTHKLIHQGGVLIGTSGMADGAITVAKLASEAWVDYVPTLTNLTLGNGIVVMKYIKLGRTIHYRFRFVLGSSSAVGTNPSFSLPVAVSASYLDAVDILGDVDFQESGVANRRGQVWTQAGAARIVGYGTTGIAVQVTATVPHTWKNGDGMSCVGTYEATS